MELIQEATTDFLVRLQCVIVVRHNVVRTALFYSEGSPTRRSNPTERKFTECLGILAQHANSKGANLPGDELLLGNYRAK